MGRSIFGLVNSAPTGGKITPDKGLFRRLQSQRPCPLYYRTLNTIFGGKIDVVDYVRRFFGSCATADVSAQLLHVFHGKGSNGKSLLLELLIYVLGEFAGKLPEEVLVGDKSKNRHPTELTVLAGLRLAVATETKEGGRLDESRAKALTGGDTITARGMRENFYSFPPSHKLVLCTNHRPRVMGTDHAIWRRLRLVPFEVTFKTDDDGEEEPRSRL